MAHPQHTRIGFYIAKPGTLDAVLDRARAELVPLLQAAPGFRRYTVVRTGPTAIVSLTGWESKAQAEEAAQNLTAWVREQMGLALLSAANHIAEVSSYTESSAAPPVYARVMELAFLPGKVDAVRERARAQYIPLLQRQPGFIRHVAFRAGAERTLTFTAFVSQQQLEAAEEATRSWREYVTPLTTRQERHAGEVVWAVRKWETSAEEG